MSAQDAVYNFKLSGSNELFFLFELIEQFLLCGVPLVFLLVCKIFVEAEEIHVELMAYFSINFFVPVYIEQRLLFLYLFSASVMTFSCCSYSSISSELI